MNILQSFAVIIKIVKKEIFVKNRIIWSKDYTILLNTNHNIVKTILGLKLNMYNKGTNNSKSNNVVIMKYALLLMISQSFLLKYLMTK